MCSEENPVLSPEHSNMHEIIRATIIIYLFYMNRSCSGYVNIIDEVETIEQVIITDNKVKNIVFIH